MKKQLSLLSLIFLVACGQGPSSDSVVVANRTEQVVGITEGEPMATADMSIDGMSCQMMCANMIKGALDKVPGVTAAEVIFHDGDEIGHAKVTYDPAKVNDAQLVGAVQALADGQYKVSSIAIVKQVKGDPAAATEPEKEHDEVSASLIPEVAMPNLVATLMALVRI